MLPNEKLNFDDFRFVCDWCQPSIEWSYRCSATNCYCGEGYCGPFSMIKKLVEMLNKESNHE